MIVSRLVAGTVIVLAAAAISAQNSTHTVCGALRDRMSLNGRTVTIRGLQKVTDEGAWLIQSGCADLAVNLGDKRYTWPASIWLDMSSKSLKAAGFDSAHLEESVRRIDKLIEGHDYKPKRDQLWLTYVGRFETFDDRLENHVSSSGERIQRFGFGHSNEAPAQLIVKEVIDFKVESR